MSTKPRLSVVMSVYNGEQYLKLAIDSVLSQTWRDFEFIIIDDGSTDGSQEIIRSYADPRIKLLTQDKHGLVYSLNRGIKAAAAEYVARMDADDISAPKRFEKQMAVLAADPTLTIVGSNYEMIDDAGRMIETVVRLTCDIDIKRQLFSHNPLCHGSVVMDKAAVVAAGGYQDVGPIEDYELWVRLFEHGARFASIPEALYRWRNNPAGISSSAPERQLKLTHKVRAGLWQRKAPPDPGFWRLVAGAYRYLAVPRYRWRLAAQYAQDQYALLGLSGRSGALMQAAKLGLVVIAILPFTLAAGAKGVIELAKRRYQFARDQLGLAPRRRGLR
jgi:glycosyltransferase involved in cell wall biosynthesis